jgi:hypothetical protein
MAKSHPSKNEKLIIPEAQDSDQSEQEASCYPSGNFPVNGSDSSLTPGGFYIHPRQHFKVGACSAPLDASG